MAIGNGVDVGDGSENLPSKDLAALSVLILLDGLSVDMPVVEVRILASSHGHAGCLCLDVRVAQGGKPSLSR
jgi:hypothetical protein